MTDTELLDFADEAFKRNLHRLQGIVMDVIIGDVSVLVGRPGGPTTFRQVIEAAVQQRVRTVTQRLTK